MDDVVHENVKAIVLFRLGGKHNWSLPLAVHPSHVASVEAYVREGKQPKYPRCTVSMYSGKSHRVFGERDHVLRWLGWDADCGKDAYDRFMAMAEPPETESPEATAPAAAAPAAAAGDGTDAVAGGPVGGPIQMSVVEEPAETTDAAPSVQVPAVPPAAEKAPPATPTAVNGADEL